MHYDLGYSLKIPFIVNLYPGGSLQTNDKATDSHLKKYLCSPYCKKVIVTQNYIFDYLLKNKLCPKEKIEFVFGVVMGMALGMSGAILSAQKEMPTAEDQMKIRDIVYKHIPDIRERIFN